MTEPIPLLIIGAGPYGLVLSAYARHHNIEHMIVGKPMGFWKANMPQGMYLRSACDWHYDPFNEHTIEHFLTTRHLKPNDVEPLSLNLYLDYVDWFQQQKKIEVQPALVRQLDYAPSPHSTFQALMEDGQTVTAKNVVLAVGFRYFKNVPEPYTTLFPQDRCAHTCDLVDLAPLRDRRVLIIGGRQSAFEWAALLHEQGAAEVSVSYRHPTPAFTPSDWTWVNPIVDGMVSDPTWFRRRTVEEKDQVIRRMWAEGRLKLEPWLAARLDKGSIRLLPESQVTGCRELAGGELEIGMNDGSAFAVDQVILATGYKVNVARVPFLAQGNLLGKLETQNGFPVLDEHLQSNIPGLYLTSMCATQDFGPFFAFTAAVRTSANLIGAALS
jgi:FAD-dependent urate hydroxylase